MITWSQGANYNQPDTVHACGTVQFRERHNKSLNVCAWSCSSCLIPYSGKFSLVQNFAELPPSPSEENFVVLNFELALW